MTSGPRLGGERRLDLASAYLSGADRYARVRPGYPAGIVDWIVPDDAADAADVGAGTGIFTGLLADRGLRVSAVDPSEAMLAVLSRQLPGVPVILGTAEESFLPTAAVDLVTLAQAWHWCDHPAAAAEAARVLRPSGRLAVVWNQLDVSRPWVHRLSRIMHAGDVYSPAYRPEFGSLFAPPEELLIRWTQELTVSDVVDLARSRSYYRRASPELRARVEANLLWYLTDHLAFAPDARLELPYYTHAWRATKNAVEECAPQRYI
ncbi:class I SAM-dependent methyltransferase [Arthrobacter echini]|uniref:Class I SAM-dependent methyltransferase n=1 Tax=Arthrobacter echini TaxID=1529066 RepID=A0A5D0XU36_9MICC|nr:class I SAM-dependent methyltransferase [Arthrobacter echini]TYC99688.1 class I SAM-dependent methyltransferase [Arthrobacter echini]